MDREVKIKIIEKLNGIVLIRKFENEKAIITIPEFKYIITRYSIKKSQWFKIAKDLENDGYIRLHCRNPIEVLSGNVIDKG